VIAQAGSQPVLQLEQAVRQLVGSTNQLAALQRASLKQVYCLDDLCDRWSLSKDQVLALLHEHCGYRGVSGVKPRTHLDDVLRLDAILRAATTGRTVPA
jgi:hypothetical protein